MSTLTLVTQPTLHLTLLGSGRDRVSSAHGCRMSPVCTHHVYNSRHTHHLQQPIIHAWPLKPWVAVGTPQVGTRAPAAPKQKVR